jgi:hypothetical protein
MRRGNVVRPTGTQLRRLAHHIDGLEAKMVAEKENTKKGGEW